MHPWFRVHVGQECVGQECAGWECVAHGLLTGQRLNQFIIEEHI